LFYFLEPLFSLDPNRVGNRVNLLFINTIVVRSLYLAYNPIARVFLAELAILALPDDELD
jgi:hypothetical protein